MTTAAAVAPIWVTARAAGIAALLAASCSACLGLVSALRPQSTRGKRIEIAAAHEAVALVTIALIVVHAIALLADPVLKPGLAGLLIPGAAPFKALATALGQIAAYGMLGLGLSYYARKRLGTQRWRSAHRFIPAFWLLAVIHGLTVGTDAGQWWFVAGLGLPVVTAAALLCGRYADSLMPQDQA
jgi:sulfoxide reductase heme-binding subunit YedZ